jgi:hypothetical protein
MSYNFASASAAYGQQQQAYPQAYSQQQNYAGSAGWSNQQQQAAGSASWANASASNWAAAAAAAAPAAAAAAWSQQQSSHQQQQSSWSSSAAAHGSSFQSQVEQQVVNAQQPIQTNEREQVQAGQYQGTFLNKQEVDNWRGPIPIEQYRINDDPNPEVIRKRLDKLKYRQEVAVRYLNPPPAPKPGDIIVRERQSQIPPAPPVVLRQEACQAATPPPQVFREHPPAPPPQIPEQVVEIEGAPVPPPARRVVIEKLTSLPPKPQNILIEKWLPYQPQKRRVVYQPSCAQAQSNPRNLVIEWEAPDVEVEQQCVNLGVQDADPYEYVRRYGSELRQPGEMPQLCQCQQQQQSCGCDGNNQLPELEGDVQALA